MKKRLFIMLFLVSSLMPIYSATANPFYGEETTQKDPKQAVKNGERFAKHSQNKTACELPTSLNTLNINTEFEDLKLVGIIKQHNQFKALFKDKENRLVSFKENDYLEAQLIQIKEINLKSVQYIHWGLTDVCETPHILTIKL